ncbi:DNA cytosine methyltransferase [Mesorhizobium sp. M1307]|uniref:DNA cytosine methyltransferase n=1 Tax=Mesorhizobium sp. M1307 TaxID=2957079 RepID=UPI0033385C6F
MTIQFDFGDVTLTPAKKQKWRCLPVPGFMRAAKVPLPVLPPPRRGERRVRVVDSFAGGGGASNGIEEALRRLAAAGLLPEGHSLTVDYAVNHDEAALAMHEANHRDTIHLPHNVWQVSMRETLGDDLFGFLWLSPDCRDHSAAKGGPITSRAVRDLAWVLLKWLKELPDWQKPWTICLENVDAFAKWSPLIELPDGTGFMRDPERIGHTFHQFVYELSRHGYSVGWGKMAACDYGDPTIRKRLYLCARRDADRIEIPKPTHGEPKSDTVRKGALKPWPVAADIIDFGLDCPSIFLTREEAREYAKATGRKIIRPLATKTDARLAKGVKRHVIDAAEKGEAFIVTCNHSGDGFRGQGLSEPFNTVAATRDAHGLVVPHVAVFRGDSIGRPAGAPLPAVTANSFIKRPGGAAPLGVTETMLAPFVSRGQHGGGNRPSGDPLHTIAASDGDQNQLVVPYLVPRYGERDSQEPRTASVERPLPTPVPDGNQGSLAAVYLAQHNTGEEGHGALRPVSTIVQKGCTQGVVAAHMLSLHGSDRRDGSCEDPAPSACAGGNHSAVVTLPLMTAYYSNSAGDGSQASSIDYPLPAATTRDRFGLTHVDAAPRPLSDRQMARARQVAAFLRAHGCWDGGDVVTITIGATVFIIIDIGMRMLTPRELARAQGFPDSYILNPIYKGKPLTETEQRHKIGNSVCKLPAAAFIEANYRPPLEWGRQAFLEAAE